MLFTYNPDISSKVHNLVCFTKSFDDQSQKSFLYFMLSCHQQDQNKGRHYHNLAWKKANLISFTCCEMCRDKASAAAMAEAFMGMAKKNFRGVGHKCL